ncbi:transglutaminase-like domain-containing protein [Lysinibacillus pakistanensis]|uniref:Transglutaminase n=1 Tax=Lysinibacillus pakistanensis TaxID=759811 RepID=A0AAX3X1H5_9BACI|nr:transglutaminase-like domain-containing protein [Lysinibacillus pakistanensis]MDM5232016.1 transglutaminase-like domain-containing protein [Lysinibacillus pakistanensis]QGG50199.1 transglutaminase [Lysinibacillus pakistanensis]WHY47542.1 transglutaminase-like domain-containing protein [Lysinibacillus pakistanensis]WHY52552.1 transglutaminase-like domain-containing protein [Lysinibacillus pakistanensis]
MMKYLEPTAMLNFQDEALQQLVKQRGWSDFAYEDRIKEIYDFVRNEIKFGYNRTDDIPASEVLRDGYGQCNTKSTLLMALLRAVGIPCRIHGFLIDKKMQKGALTGITYLLAPSKIVHAWTEVQLHDDWIVLEGVIIDDSYLKQVKSRLCSFNEGFIGYGISVKDKDNINLCWTGESVYVQSFSITDDLGIFDNPDDLFKKYNNTDSKLKEILFNKKRKKINKRLDMLRDQ